MSATPSATTAGRAVVITGVSTGIGYAAARLLTQRGFTVFGSVRRDSDGERVRRELGDKLVPLVFDVTDAVAIARAVATVRAQLNGTRLTALVNNSGIGIGGPLALQPIDEIRAQFEVNVLGLFAVTQAFLPLLGTDDTLRGTPGRIINISSVGGKIGGPFLGAYVGTKHALEGMSESLRRELMLFGIDVILIGPGAIATPIWDKAEQTDETKYADTKWANVLSKFGKHTVERGRAGLPPERVATVIADAIVAPNPKVRYAIVPEPFANWIVPRLLPRRMIDRIIAKRLGFVR